MATAAAGVPEARARFGTTGRGATVCVVDTGIDLAHRDFRDRAGATRVRWLLEMGAPPRGGSAASLESRFGGAVWEGAEIDVALTAGSALPEDRHGHGTAVASVAAGDDADDGPPGPRAGVAPEASLIVVHALRPGAVGFDDTDVEQGVRFCAAVAGRGEAPTDGARTVAVLGLGGHDGMHDGTEPLEVALSEIAMAGLPIVVAAGNDGDRDVHAAGTLGRGEVARIPLWIPSPEPPEAERYVSVSLQSRVPQPVAVAIEAPDGTRTEWIGPGDSGGIDHDGGRSFVDGRSGVGPGEGRSLYALVTGGGDVPVPLTGGSYALLVRGPGRFDAWIVGYDLGAAFGGPSFAGPFVERPGGIVIPGGSPALVTVGAALARAALDTDHGSVVIAGAEVGEPAPFSAVGPAWSGAPKPDLVAPGGLVVAALSGSLDPDDPHGLFGGSRPLWESRRVGSDRVGVMGTSFAAPMVAGALALAFEGEPCRGEADRHLLSSTAAPPSDGLWSPRAGAGVLDVEAFLAVRGDAGRGGPPDPDHSALVPTRRVVVPGASDLFLFVRVADRAGVPVLRMPVVLTMPDGRSVRTEATEGIAIVPATMPTSRPGDVLLFSARVGDLSLEPAVVGVGLDGARQRMPPEAVGSGCAAAGRPAPDDAWWIWLPVALVLTCRRSA